MNKFTRVARKVRFVGARSLPGSLMIVRARWADCLRVTCDNDTRGVAIHKYLLCLPVAMTYKADLHEYESHDGIAMRQEY